MLSVNKCCSCLWENRHVSKRSMFGLIVRLITSPTIRMGHERERCWCERRGEGFCYFFLRVCVFLFCFVFGCWAQLKVRRFKTCWCWGYVLDAGNGSKNWVYGTNARLKRMWRRKTNNNNSSTHANVCFLKSRYKWVCQFGHPFVSNRIYAGLNWALAHTMATGIKNAKTNVCRFIYWVSGRAGGVRWQFSIPIYMFYTRTRPLVRVASAGSIAILRTYVDSWLGRWCYSATLQLYVFMLALACIIYVFPGKFHF